MTSIIHDFDDQDLSPYSGDTSNFGFFEVATGDYLLGSDASSYSHIYSHPGDGLNYYPSRGDTLICDYHVEDSSNDGLGVYFGVQDSSNHYRVDLDPFEEHFAIFKDGGNPGDSTPVTSSTESIGTGQYRIEIDWGTLDDPNEIEARYYNGLDAETPETTISTVDADYDDGGVGFFAWSSQQAGFNNYRAQAGDAKVSAPQGSVHSATSSPFALGNPPTIWAELEHESVAGSISSAAHDAETDRIAFCDESSTETHIWKAESHSVWNELTTLDNHSPNFDAAWHPTDTHLAVAHSDSDYLYVYDTETWDRIHGFGSIPVSGSQWAVDYEPSGNYVAIGAQDGGVTVCDPADSYNEVTSWSSADEVLSLSFSPDGAYLAVGAGVDETGIRVYETDGWTEVFADDPYDAIFDLDWDTGANGDVWLFAACEDQSQNAGGRAIYQYESDTDSFSQHDLIDTSNDEVIGVAVSDTREHVVWGEETGPLAYAHQNDQKSFSLDATFADNRSGSILDVAAAPGEIVIPRDDGTVTRYNSIEGHYTAHPGTTAVSTTGHVASIQTTTSRTVSSPVSASDATPPGVPSLQLSYHVTVSPLNSSAETPTHPVIAGEDFEELITPLPASVSISSFVPGVQAVPATYGSGFHGQGGYGGAQAARSVNVGTPTAGIRTQPLRTDTLIFEHDQLDIVQDVELAVDESEDVTLTWGNVNTGEHTLAVTTLDDQDEFTVIIGHGDWRLLDTATDPEDSIFDLEFAANEREHLCFGGGPDEGISIYEPRSPDSWFRLGVVDGPDSGIWSLASTNGYMFGSSRSRDGEIHIWETGDRPEDWSEREVLSSVERILGDWQFRGNFDTEDRTRAVDFNSDTTFVTYGDRSGRIYTRDVGNENSSVTTRTWPLKASVHTGHGQVAAVDHHPSDDILAVACRNEGVVEVYETQNWDTIATLELGASYTRDVAFSPDASFIAFGGTNNAVRIFDVGDSTGSGWTHVTDLDTDGIIEAVDFDESSQTIAFGGRDGTLRIHDVGLSDGTGWTELKTDDGFDDLVEDVAFSHESTGSGGPWVAAVGGENFRVYDHDGSSFPLKHTETSTDVLRSCEFTAADDQLAVGGDETMTVRETGDWNIDLSEPEDVADYTALGTSPNGDWMAAADRELNTIHIYDPLDVTDLAYERVGPNAETAHTSAPVPTISSIAYITRTTPSNTAHDIARDPLVVATAGNEIKVGVHTASEQTLAHTPTVVSQTVNDITITGTSSTSEQTLAHIPAVAVNDGATISGMVSASEQTAAYTPSIVGIDNITISGVTSASGHTLAHIPAVAVNDEVVISGMVTAGEQIVAYTPSVVARDNVTISGTVTASEQTVAYTPTIVAEDLSSAYGDGTFGSGLYGGDP